ncbi:MAG: DUF2062 domain-containing protein [Deltaproteobacteria bacterium]|jgi:uncharacterized protein (DUF2062 family)|nr:DUF2062 domain-containing protein [Deltaproteobacteria bacterium]
MWRWITAPVMKRVRVVMSSGLTRQKLALTLCLGIAFGILPLLWGTSLLCILLAHMLRLNHVALQSVNYLLYPLQLALLVPFFKLGAQLFPWGPSLPPQILYTLGQSSALSSLNILGWIMLRAIAAWLVTALPLALLVYGILRATVFKESTQTFSR